jgi:hypothetical protein
MAERMVLIPEETLTSATLIIDSLPKRLRNKGKILITHLGDSIKLNSDKRVVYKDGEVGSNIIDLIKYFVSNVKKRPIDAPRFEELIMMSNVPQNVLRQRNQTVEWYSL